MPRGASPKREREYEEIVEKSKEEGRYKGREKEVAARIVNKQRREAGETRSARGRSKKASKTRTGSRKAAAKKASPRKKTATRKPSSTRNQGSRRAKQASSARTARKPATKSTGRSQRTGRKVSTSPLTHYTVDHDEIRTWAEDRGGKPSHVVRTKRAKGDAGILRLDFPGYSGAGSLEPISWDEWFEKFDQSKLALAYQDHTARGQKSNFNKLVGRESVPLN